MTDRDLPEGIIDANPAGGWESGDTADGETAESIRDAAGSGALTDSGYPSTADAGDGSRVGDGEHPAPVEVETDALSQGIDPDLSTDEEESA
jgi:hypothetical protein